MADFTIYRQGLDATIVGSASIGAQSEAVTFTVESDGSYAGYKTNLYYQYGDTRALAAASNNVFTVPVQAFKQTGDVLLSVELSSGSNRPVCNPCVLRVTSSAKQTDASVLPSDGTWQALVKTQVQNQINDTVFKPHGSINTGSFNDIKSPGGYVAGPNLTERPPESGYGYLSVTVSDLGGKAVTQEWVHVSSPYKAYRRTHDDSTHAWTEWYGVGPDALLEKMVSNAYLMGRTGKVWKRKIWKASVNGTDVCPALDDYGEGAATPFTDETAGSDPYMDSYTVFQWMYCNYTRDSDETARLKTLEGYPDFALTGAVDVGCIHPTFWWKQEEHGDYFELYFSDSPHEELGLIPWRDAVKSDGTVLPYFIVSAFPSVTASDGYPRSQPGKPVNNQSYNNIVTNYVKKGTGYQGAGASINTLAMIYLIVKYQTKLEQTKFSGNSNFTVATQVALAESDTKRVLLPAGTTAYKAHDGITVGTAKNAWWLNGSLVPWAEITSVETVTVNGTNYVALNLDVSSTFTTTTAMYVCSSACPSGQTMRVMGHYDGSYISNTDNHHSFRIEGI